MKKNIIQLTLVLMSLFMSHLSQGQSHNETSGTDSGENLTGSYNAFFGDLTGSKGNPNSGNKNSFFGYGSGHTNTSGSDNSFFGYRAGRNNLNGELNTFIGFESGFTNVSGHENTFVGYKSGHQSIGYFNTFVGHDSGYATTSDYNAFFGWNAGYANTIGYENVFIGAASGVKNISGVENTFVGYESGYYNTEGDGNTFLGTGSGYNNTTGNNNTFSGRHSGYTNTTGFNNTYTGAGSGVSNTTGNQNTFSGTMSGHHNTTGKYNTFSGCFSGYNNTTGDKNVFIGYYAGYNETSSNKLYIDNSNDSTPLIYGDFSKDSLVVNGDLSIPEDYLLRTNAIHAMSNQETLNIGWDPYDSNPDQVAAISVQPFNCNGCIDTNNDIYRSVQINSSIAVRGTALTVGGAVHISPRNEAPQEFSVGTDGYLKDFLLWVERGIVSEDFAISGVDSWSDFVFEENYLLTPLNEVENFINENGHLPEVPSEEEIKENGYSMHDMNKMLLQKVEELTLYAIEQEKRITEMQEIKIKYQLLESRLAAIEEYIK